MDKYIGRLLDNRYEILEIIGTGGQAVVYKARCHRLNRLVAIKILKDEYSQDEESVTMQIKYSGNPLNPMDSDNLLSLKIAENAAQSIEYQAINTDGFTNLVIAKIKY